MKAISTPAVIEGIRAKVDKSLGLTISTPELTVQEKALFMELQGENVSLLITPTDEKKPDEYKVDSDLENKTQSQRMRNVLFIIWKQDNKKMDFPEFYKYWTDKLIEQLKGLIE